MIDLTIKSFGRIDLLICNAGISYRSIFEYVNIDVFEKLFKINFFGSVYSVKHSIPYLIKSKRKYNSNIFIKWFYCHAYKVKYVSSKHAMQGFFDSLRLELK